MTSGDGVNWIERTWRPGNSLWTVAYENGLFVAAGSGLLTSGDGLNWVQRQSGRFSGLAYGNGRFMVAGERILTSPDGLTWTWLTPSPTELSASAYGNGQFVGVAYDGAIVSSVNGVNWVQQLSVTPHQFSDQLNGLAYGNGQFVAVGDVGTILTSTDNVIWTQRRSGTTDQLRGSLTATAGFWQWVARARS